ncbi:hypothetical protein FOA52_000501 [Chlamydomonas sp. UWO 241]|nr:hypothetical protein FOA52_000501 [Chlamydomonas sp. UWO 241]
MLRYSSSSTSCATRRVRATRPSALAHRVLCRAQDQSKEAKSILDSTGMPACNGADTLASRRATLMGLASALAFGGVAGKASADNEPDEYPTKSGIVSPKVENTVKEITEGAKDKIGNPGGKGTSDPRGWDLPFDLPWAPRKSVTDKAKEGIDKVAPK